MAEAALDRLQKVTNPKFFKRSLALEENYSNVSTIVAPDDVNAEKISIRLKSVAESLLIEAWWYVAHIEGHRRVGCHLRTNVWNFCGTSDWKFIGPSFLQ